MLHVFLTKDPETLRGLYDSEAQLLGVFPSVGAAEEALGELLNYCSLRYLPRTLH